MSKECPYFIVDDIQSDIDNILDNGLKNRTAEERHYSMVLILAELRARKARYLELIPVKRAEILIDPCSNDCGRNAMTGGSFCSDECERSYDAAMDRILGS